MLHRTCAAAWALAVANAFAAPGPVSLQNFATGFSAPVDIANARDGSKRLFVVEQGGRIRVVNAAGQVQATPFLDLTGLVRFGGEMGLLGLAFEPGYATTGRFYVFYNRALVPAVPGSELVVARYRRSAANPNVADPASGEDLLVIPHPQQENHNGGRLAFGPDGHLYIGTGDGGGGGDPFGNGQNLTRLLGKILRIDVTSAPSPGLAYAIPPDNPFLPNLSARAEIFAYGVRNPWRFSFDRATGDLWIADVGQNAWEEVDLLPAGTKGQNLGWPVFEGTHCFSPSTNCSLPGGTLPVIEYPHNATTGGFSITGGFRYRGHKVRELAGAYVYADYVSGNVWGALPSGNTWTPTKIGARGSITAFGEDEDGELYAADAANGVILRFAPVDADGDGMSDGFEAQYFGAATAGDPKADSDGDGLSNLVEYREGTNPLVKDNDVFTSTRLAVMQQYRDFLGREGDEAGIRFWIDYLVPPPGQGRPTLSPPHVVQAFFDSPEFQDLAAPVTRLYSAYFLRIPDTPGLAFWIGQRRAGTSLEAISQSFATSPEFTSRYGLLDNAQFVALVYQNVLGRAPDPGGFAFWTAQLDTNAMNRGTVMLGFSESAEFKAANASETFVTTMYVGMLGRAPDPAGFQFWVGQLDSGASGFSLIDSVFQSSEYRGRFLP